ncbi:hypothetical protein MLD38_014876 [Melastoma candidum]|uniref:Uncharacterized protein n=1 Tax=Melastoma candidum TaxID=119954 RepID=A0ACB9RHW9_9MYRT|nr:hypothetical protein MLD38_014876 [Melastoma candidum]
MSSCLRGGSRTYGLDLEIVKATTTVTTRNSPTSSSPSSTISESSNSPLSICTRKARTHRKRPNQTYNEAAALLSTAYPNIFPARHLTDPRNSHRPHRANSPEDSSELFLPFRVIVDESVFLIRDPSEEPKPSSFFQIEQKFSPSRERSYQTPEENEIQSKAAHCHEDYTEDFDAESILDEEIEEGIIDSIMGEKGVGQETENLDGQNNVAKSRPSWCRNPGALLGIGSRLDICYGFRRKGVSAWRDVGEVNWWNFPTVDVNAISPKLNPSGASNNNSATEKKKKKKKIEKPRQVPLIEADIERISNIELAKTTEDSPATSESGGRKAGLILKLDYNNVLDAWSGRGCSPFPDESPAPGVAGNDVAARLMQIDLFGEGGGTREASVQRYKEKRRTRLFSKKIRYQVRKLNAECRPRMKGRFVRRSNSKSIKDVDDGGIGNVPKSFRKK